MGDGWMDFEGEGGDLRNGGGRFLLRHHTLSLRG